MSQPVITVFGSGTCTPDTPEYAAARELGQAIAGAGWTLCNGGYGGTMEAAARGAREAGGHTIGVTCRIFGRSGPNPHIVQEVPTFDLLTRLDILVRLGQAYVALPGGTGTLLELALVWELLNKRLLKRVHPTIVILGEHWTPLISPIHAAQPDALPPLVARDIPQTIALLQRGLDQGPVSRRADNNG